MPSVNKTPKFELTGKFCTLAYWDGVRVFVCRGRIMEKSLLTADIVGTASGRGWPRPSAEPVYSEPFWKFETYVCENCQVKFDALSSLMIDVSENNKMEPLEPFTKLLVERDSWGLRGTPPDDAGDTPFGY